MMFASSIPKPDPAPGTPRIALRGERRRQLPPWIMNKTDDQGVYPGGHRVSVCLQRKGDGGESQGGCGSVKLLVVQHPACWPAVGVEDRTMTEVARVWSSFERRFDGPDQPVCELPLHTSRRPALGA